MNNVLSLCLPVSQLCRGKSKDLKPALRKVCPDSHFVFGFQFAQIFHPKTVNWFSFLSSSLCRKVQDMFIGMPSLAYCFGI